MGFCIDIATVVDGWAYCADWRPVYSLVARNRVSHGDCESHCRPAASSIKVLKSSGNPTELYGTYTDYVSIRCDTLP